MFEFIRLSTPKIKFLFSRTTRLVWWSVEKKEEKVYSVVRTKNWNLTEHPKPTLADWSQQLALVVSWWEKDETQTLMIIHHSRSARSTSIKFCRITKTFENESKLMIITLSLDLSNKLFSHFTPLLQDWDQDWFDHKHQNHSWPSLHHLNLESSWSGKTKSKKLVWSRWICESSNHLQSWPSTKQNLEIH